MQDIIKNMLEAIGSFKQQNGRPPSVIEVTPDEARELRQACNITCANLNLYSFNGVQVVVVDKEVAQ